MKRNKISPALLLLAISLIILFMFSPDAMHAQILGGTAPVNPPAGGFAIDGNLQANTPTPAGIGDWLAGGSGSGGYVLGNTGLPVLSETTYHLVDLYNSSGDNTYAKGKLSTNPNDHINYTWALSPVSQAKCDMNHALIHFTTDNNGHVWVVFAADRLGTVGSSYMDFEFLQNTLVKNADGTFTSAGPDYGRTVGDFVLTVAFGNAGTEFHLLRWQPYLTGYSYIAPSITIPEGSVYATYNTTQVPSPNYLAFGNSYYTANTYIEAAVDLTAVLGAVDPCNGLVVKTIFVKTKGSADGNSNVEDFFDPLPVNNISLGNADAGPDDAVCPGLSLILQGEAIPSPGYNVTATTWSIVSGTGTIENGNTLNPSITVTASPATFRLTVETSNGPSTCIVHDDVVITSEDNEDPTIACIDDQVRDADPGACNYTVVGQEFDPTDFGDNCPDASIINDYNNLATLADAVFEIGTTTVTWTVTDASSQTATCSYNVTIEDNADPEITCVGDQSRDTDPGGCTYTVSGSEFDPLSFGDNCETSSVTNDYNNLATLDGAIFPKGTTTVTWTVTDATRNVNSCVFDVTIEDHEAPAIECKDNETRSTNEDVCTYTAVGSEFDPVSVWDNCPDYTWVNSLNGDASLEGYVFQKGTTQVTWTVTDDSGFNNSASCNFDIIVEDHQAPVIECKNQETRDTDADVCTYTTLGDEFDPVSVWDNCPGYSWVNSLNGEASLEGYVFQKGTTPVTWTVTDDSGFGNSASCSFDIIVEDHQAPTIECRILETRNTNDDVCTYTTVGNEFDPVSVWDNCAGYTWVNNLNGGASLEGYVFQKGTTPVTWTITDDSGFGNSASCSFDVIVEDRQAPAIECKTEQIRNTDENVCTYTAVGNEFDPVSVWDNCPDYNWVNSLNGEASLEGYVFQKGTTPVTWTITDNSGFGNSASCSFDVIVEDHQPPTIECNTEQIRNTDADVCTYTTVGTEFDPVSVWDNCPGYTWVNSLNGEASLEGYVFQKGTTPVTWTVTDDSGFENTVSCNFTVKIEDHQNPTIACMAEQVRNTDPGICTYSTIGDEFDPTSVWDNCPGYTWVNSLNGEASLEGYVFQKGTTPVTWTVTDDSGFENTVSCSFDVVVEDHEIPSVSCVTNKVRNTDTGVCTYTTVATEFNPTSVWDNCPGYTWVNNLNGTASLAGYIFSKGTTTVIWTVTDASGFGNSASCSFTVTVGDHQNPTIACVGNQVRNANTGICTYTAVGTEFNPTMVWDNCPGYTYVNNLNGTTSLAGYVFPKGTTTVTWTVTDASGFNNTASCSFTVKVEDHQNPAISCVGNQVRNTNPGACNYTTIGTEFNPVSVSDNCPNYTYANNLNNTTSLAGYVFQKGTTTVTWTVTDASGFGNSSACSFTVTVEDHQNPTITCAVPASSYPTAVNNCTYTVPGTALNPTSTGDNCSVASVVNNKTGTSTLQGAVFQLGTTNVIWTVTDGSGNTATCSYNINVVDNRPPVWTTAANALNATLSCGDNAGLAAAQQLNPVATDNCDNDVSDIVKTAGGFVPGGTCSFEGTYTNTWVVTDINGNTSPVYTQVISIEDNTPPTFTPLKDTIIIKNAVCIADIDPSVLGYPENLADNCDPQPAFSWTDENCYSTTISGQMNHGVGYYYPIYISGYDDFSASDLQKVFLSFSTQKGKGNVEFTLIAPNGDGVMLIGPYCNGGYCDDLYDMTTYSPYFFPYSSGYTKWMNSNYIAPGEGQFRPFAGVSAENSVDEVDYLERYVDKFENLTGPMNGMWVIYGRKWGTATGTMSFNGACISPVDCDVNDLVVRTWTATDACGNTSSSYRQSIIIRDLTPPQWVTPAGNLDRVVPVGDAQALAAAQALAPVATDNCTQGIVPSKTAGTFVPLAYCPQCGSYTNTWRAFDGCGNIQQELYTQVITVSDYHDITGTITYNNNFNTPMDGVSLSLYKGSGIIATTTTSSSGYFEFNDLISGVYHLGMTTAKIPSGVNSSDAGQVNYWWTHAVPIEHVRWDAGNFKTLDHNFINAADAGSIQGYFVNGEPLPQAYWTFYRQQCLSDLNPPPLQEDSYQLCSEDLFLDYYALCVGDFSRNFNPLPGSMDYYDASALRLEIKGSVKAAAGAIVEIPIQVTSAMQLSAVSLILEIPENLVIVEDVYMKDGPDLTMPGKLDWSFLNSRLRIGWNSIVPVDLEDFSTLLTLKLRTTASFSQDNGVRISLVPDPLNELADGFLEPIEKAILQTYAIEATSTDIDGHGEGNGGLELASQPNPFYGHTNLTYTLPFEGHVTLEITSSLGTRTIILVDERQMPGNYKVKFDTYELQPGVYTATLKLKSRNDAKTSTIKMVRAW